MSHSDAYCFLQPASSRGIELMEDKHGPLWKRRDY